ncbi:uncharacterized protein LOC127289292 [Leptopilina boulardi]|uniref:uncharacterized protein LOC127289292 n=1 Tax=Leptopilina boulardi TaxID=63433 RepID=UPI0021F698D7|nr:uncharacterized protein LOC127289292 [Leptopilina boulardi]
MESSRRKRYKTYLEPGSRDPIPSSSKYRYQKLNNKQVIEPHSKIGTSNEQDDAAINVEIHLENVQMEEHDYPDASMIPETEEEETFSTEFESCVKSNMSTYDDCVNMHDVIVSLEDDLDDIETNVLEFTQIQMTHQEYVIKGRDW